jgi:hypothetical protein
MCEQLALAYVEAFSSRPPLRYEEAIDQYSDDSEEDPLEGEGEKRAAPEMGPNWDPLERWTERARWRFHEEEHNNILEARASAGAVSILLENPKAWGKRCLLFTDSQVVLGVLSKGRSSVKALNRMARRVAALTYATGAKLYWRYVRTHRNHSDGPSRGFPIGVAPEPAGPSRIPDEFYTRTKG